MLTGDLHLIKHPNMERDQKNSIVIDVTFLINRSKNIRYFNARCLFCDVFTMKFCYDWFRLGFQSKIFVFFLLLNDFLNE